MKSSALLAVSFCALCVLSACGGGASNSMDGGGGSQVTTHFAVTAPAAATVRASFSVTVTALDASDNTVASYSGTVHLTSSDPQAVLSPDTTLANGKQDFLVTLENTGSQTITATDTVRATIRGNSNSIEVATTRFQPTGNMGTERAAHTATLLQDGKVLIAGGFNSTGVLATAELFDPVAGTFTATGSMTAVRFSHTATLLPNGKVLIAGGSNNLGALATHDSHSAALFATGKRVVTDGSISSFDLATAELFDPATGTFTTTGTMAELRSQHTATLLNNGKVLVAGGTADNLAELFDPATGTFTSTAGELVVGGRWGCTATLLQDGTVLIAGGRDDEDVFDADPLPFAELFNPATATFMATGDMAESRYEHTAALLNNGQVLVTGGFNGVPMQEAELFDPTTGSFSRTGVMGSARADHTETVLEDGTVLVAGGFGGDMVFASAEIFDSATSVFAPTGGMAIGRNLHTATLLNNGQVLVAGGQSSAGPSFNSAELFK